MIQFSREKRFTLPAPKAQHLEVANLKEVIKKIY